MTVHGTTEGPPPIEQQLKEAEDKLAAVLKLTGSGRMLLDAREVATAAGQPPACTCASGAETYRLRPDCTRHGAVRPSDQMLAALMPAIENGAGWVVKPHNGFPVPTRWETGQWLNIVAAVLERLCDPSDRPI